MPQMQRGELLLRVHAVSLNYRDIAIATGKYVQAGRPGLVPTSDAAAEVVAVGEDVEAFKVGDQVISIFHPRWFGGRRPAAAYAGTYGNESDGWLTEYKVISQEAVVGLPDSLGYEEGCTLPCAAATAWNALTGSRPIRAGDTVLTLGTGGVSIFALQLAKQVGARVISTTSSANKAETLRSLGAYEVIDYSDLPDWGEKVRSLTGGQGVNRVVEVVGSATINQSLRAVASGEEVVLIGFLSEEKSGIKYSHLIGSGAVVRSISVGDRSNLEDLVQAVSMTGLKPVIDQVFAFSDAKQAFSHLASGHHLGKIVIRVCAE